jgi:hypothetical protein
VLGRSTELHPWRGLLAQRVDVPRARHALELVLDPVGELHARAYDELLDVEETTPRPARERADASADGDGQAAKILFDRLALAGVDACRSSMPSSVTPSRNASA